MKFSITAVPSLLTALLLTVSAQGAAQPRILVLGDSLSAAYGIEREQGWVAKLAERVRAEGYPHVVINASVSGETTAGGLSRLPPLMRRHRPAVVVIELGANDGLRGMPMAALRRNLAELVATVRENDARPLLLGMRLPPNYGPDYVDSFHSVYVDVAREHDVALVPFMLEGVALEPGMMQGDGLHPSARAQERILDNVWRVLRPLLERRRAARAPRWVLRPCST